MADDDVESKIMGLISRVEKGEPPPVAAPAAAPAAEPPAGETPPAEVPPAEGEKPIEEPPAKKEGEEPPKRPGGYVRKIAKLETANTDLTNQLESLRAEIAALKTPVAPNSPGAGRVQNQPAVPSPAGEVIVPFPKPKPAELDFETQVDFLEALADWKMEERDWKATQTRQAAEIRQSREKVDAFVEKKMQEGIDKYGSEDFDGASNDVGHLLINAAGKPAAAHLMQYIMRQDNFAELTMALAVNANKELDEVLATGNVEDACLEIKALSRKLKSQGSSQNLKSKESTPAPALRPNRIEAPGTGVKVQQSELQQLQKLREKAESSRLEDDRVAYFQFKESLRKRAG